MSRAFHLRRNQPVVTTFVVAAFLWSATPTLADNYVTYAPIGPAFASSDTNATAFIHHSILTVGTQQFVTYYNNNENVTVARRTLGDDNWDVYPTSFTAYDVSDGHDVISFGIDGAGYMHLSWGMHNNSLLYAKSTAPVTGSNAIAFTGVIAMTGFENTVCYPQFYELPDGDLLYFFREGGSGDGDSYWDRYDVSAGTWHTVHGGTGQSPFFRGSPWSPDYNLYPNLAAFDSTGTLHLTGTIRYNDDSPTGQSGFQTNHDVFYFRSFDEAVTWVRMDGTPYTLPISEFGENGDPNTAAEVALTIPEGSSLINQCSMTVDADDRPVFAMYWAPEAALGNHARQYMLGWYDGSQWHTSQITNHATDYDPDGDGTNEPIPESQLFNYRMSRPAVLVDDDNRVFVLYSDYHRGGVVTAAWSDDRVHWNFVDLTNEDAGGWEPTVDMVMWQTEHQAHMLYLPTGHNSVETAQVLMWDAAAFIADPPQPPAVGPGVVLLADTFESTILGDAATQAGALAPATYTTNGASSDAGNGLLRLNVASSAGSGYVSPLIDLTTAGIASAGGYMVTLTGVDPVVGGDGTSSDWFGVSVLRTNTSGTDPIVLNSPYAMLLRDDGEAAAFTSGMTVLQQIVDPTPPQAYAQRFVVEYLTNDGTGPARVSSFVSLPATDTVIYAHNFDGSGGALNGTAVDVGGATWQAGAAFRDNGAVNTVVSSTANGQAAFLPFAPESGYIYTLAVEVENHYADWIACGFLPALPPGGDWTATDYTVRHSNNGAYAWMLTRESTGDNQQAFCGPSTASQAFSGNLVTTATPVEITIVLDTRAATWTAQFFLNGVSRGVYNLGSGANTSIGGVGFSRDRNATTGTGGLVDNFLLTVSAGSATLDNLALVHTAVLPNAPLTARFFTLEARNAFSAVEALEVRALVPGDANLDCIVDLLDANTLFDALGGSGERLDGDFTLDERLDLEDVAILQQNYGFGLTR